MVIVKFKRVDGNADITLPKYQTDGAAAFDLHAAVKESVVLKPGERKLIPTGFMMEFPKGFVAHIVPRSGLALKYGIGIVNSPGTIDSDYRGEVGIILTNFGHENFTVNRNDRVAQMLIKRYEHAELVEAYDLSSTERGTGGYGSSGK
jgi:dUTP pyrophosphatase